jgi:hypothetical protein
MIASMSWEERFGDDLAIGYDEKEQPLGLDRLLERAPKPAITSRQLSFRNCPVLDSTLSQGSRSLDIEFKILLDSSEIRMNCSL